MPRYGFSTVPFLCLLVSGLAFAADGPFADGLYVPPGGGKAAAPGLKASVAAEYVDHVQMCHVFDSFQGKNDALRKAALANRQKALHGGEVVDVAIEPAALLGEAQQDGATWVYSASITSVDAQAIRLRVNLSQLQPDEEVFVIAPESSRAFGPYTSADGRPGERWLASVQGDEAILVVRSPRATLPQLTLTGYSHIFLSMADVAKEMSCNLDVSCETDAAVLEAATATAIILVGGEWFCSGQLINNELTAEQEPFFVTANHCICSGEEAVNTEVYWDFRSPSCDSTDIPDMDEVPRNNGEALLATHSSYDTTLIRLDGAEVGDYGRSYLGWDARDPVVGESVYTIHYPDAAHCRITKGTIRATNQTLSGYSGQIETHWDYGVTEAGSSGACLLYGNSNRLAGMLSQGPTHSCTSTINNLDWFGSFQEFYPYVSQYIDTATPSTDSGADDCGGSDVISCPFSISYESSPQMLEKFRALRNGLTKTASGQWAVDEYKTIAPVLAEWVHRSDTARGMFVAVTAPLAGVADLVSSAVPRR